MSDWTGRRCERECERLFFFLCGPATSCRLVQGVTPPSPEDWWDICRVPSDPECTISTKRKWMDEWLDGWISGVTLIHPIRGICVTPDTNASHFSAFINLQFLMKSEYFLPLYLNYTVAKTHLSWLVYTILIKTVMLNSRLWKEFVGMRSSVQRLFPFAALKWLKEALK